MSTAVIGGARRARAAPVRPRLVRSTRAGRRRPWRRPHRAARTRRSRSSWVMSRKAMAQHDGAGGSCVDAEQAGVGERVAGQGLHQRAGQAERRADQEAGDRARHAQVPHDQLGLAAPPCTSASQTVAGDRLRAPTPMLKHHDHQQSAARRTATMAEAERATAIARRGGVGWRSGGGWSGSSSVTAGQASSEMGLSPASAASTSGTSQLDARTARSARCSSPSPT